MKAKFLMMGILGVVTVALGSCSDDPKNDFPKSEFEIRQLRLDASNENNGTSARSSENPASGSVTIKYRTIAANPVVPAVEGESDEVKDAEGNPVATPVTFTKPTDAVIGYPGQTVEVVFTPGQKVTTAKLTLMHGGDIDLSAEEPSYDYTLDEFTDGQKITGIHTLEQDGSIYNYTGEIYFWHYHPINLTVTNNATGNKACTMKYDAAKNAMVRTLLYDASGSVIYDETGQPLFANESLLGVAEGQDLTLTFAPAYPDDKLAISLPDGMTAELTKDAPTLNWKVNAFEGEATIGAVLELQQANNVHLTFTGAITLSTQVN